MLSAAAQHRPSLSRTSSAGQPSSPRVQQVSSAADLTAAVRRTTGDRPPPLVGCSVTLIRDSIYVFGGRLVPTRTMVSTLYKLDLRTLVWECLWSTPTEGGGEGEEEGPQARYFHSACAWGDKLVVFGGEGYEPVVPPSSPSSSSSSPDATTTPSEDPAPALRTLSDLSIYDTLTLRWLPSARDTKVKEGVESPAPRYAHLGVVTSAVERSEDGVERERSLLVIMGGQDIKNTYLHSTNVLDLTSLTWIHSGVWDRHIGTYRAVCVAPSYTVVPASTVPVERQGEREKIGLEEVEELRRVGSSRRPTVEEPEPLLLFSNFNFTQVRRDLDLLSSPFSTPPLSPFSLSSATSSSSSSSSSSQPLPPGLRFPTGTILGHHFLVFGTFLSSQLNNFSIWALDLGEKGAGGTRELLEGGGRAEWMRIDTGGTLVKGSWNRAVGWGNSVVVLGDRERDIAADYDHRQTNFTHLAFLDLESFGIYHPPPSPLPFPDSSFPSSSSSASASSALLRLSLLSLSSPALSDFEIVCSDGKRLACSSRVLGERWGWFQGRRGEFRERAERVRGAKKEVGVEVGGEGEVDGKEDDAAPKAAAGDGEQKTASITAAATDSTDASSPRLTPRTLLLPEPSPVVSAFLQYLYTLTLSTPLQLHPPVLVALLVFSVTYTSQSPSPSSLSSSSPAPAPDPPTLAAEATTEVAHTLRAAVVHALHGVLDKESTRGAAPLVYEAATLAGCTALQIRALRCMLSNPQIRSRSSQVPSATNSGRGTPVLA